MTAYLFKNSELLYYYDNLRVIVKLVYGIVEAKGIGGLYVIVSS
jgi:hypothetical protein